MRLVINSRNCYAGAGLYRYKGEGIYKSIGRKNTSLRKVTNINEKDEADTDLDEKLEGKGIDVADSSNIEEPGSDRESSIETTSNFSGEEPVNDDKESSVDDKEETVHDNEGHALNKVNLKRKLDEETQESVVKRKYPPSIVDFLVNNNTDDLATHVPTKLHYLDPVSVSDCQESYVPPSYHRNDERMSEKSTNHHLSLICPTEGKKWPQKKCASCRQKYGLRKDTRYICIQCNVALCKPCFSDYHTNE